MKMELIEAATCMAEAVEAAPWAELWVRLEKGYGAFDSLESYYTYCEGCHENVLEKN
jgi:hypothetical protein